MSAPFGGVPQPQKTEHSDKTFQEDIPMQMFMFPVNTEAELPLEFIEHAQLASNPSIVSPEDIDTHRESWIKSWSALMLN